ncbi:Pleckstrin like proteiny domain-containing family G member 4B [Lucilia cuprina]|nr:Pleckstrin like proteiny domain-containing family G member 4B [Lucilia cuprina]
MLFGLIKLTWFDITTVGLTLVTIVSVQILNAIWSSIDDKTASSSSSPPTSSDNNGVRKSLKINELKSLMSNDSTTTNDSNTNTATTTNGKLQKQQSEQIENVSLSTTSSSLSTQNSPPPPPPPLPPLLSSFSLSSLSSPASSYPINVRNSVSYLFNGNGVSIPSIHPTTSIPDNLSDEYHEDEDTISLENLFPCDQSEIYASKKISYIIDEFIQTEGNYVNNLKKGLKNYGNLQKYDQLPEALKGDDKQQQLLGNIAEILELHEKEILPLMLRNQRDLKSMFDEMAQSIDKNQFYCYITFTMHKKTSLELRKENREFFQNYQNEINDRLGIDSFLVQPIQRLTRYPLLLQQLINEFYKSGINCKPVLASLCKLETRMRRLLEVVNQSEEIHCIEEIPPELHLEQLGSFRRSTEFDAYNHRSRKKFHSKVFLFDQCLLCTEVRKRRLAFKHSYTWDTIELKLNTSKNITLLTKAASLSGSSTNTHSSVKEEYEFSSPEAISINQWLRCARRIIEHSRIEESQKGKLVLPMDLVLGVAFAIWFIWHYL